MANVLTANPILLDTGDTNAAQITAKKYVKQITWSGIGTDYHACVLKDKVGNVLFTGTGLKGQNVTILGPFDKPVEIDGLWLYSIGSGTVHVLLA